MVCIEFSPRHGKTSLKLGSCCLMMGVYFMLAFIYSTNHSPLLLVFDGQTGNMGGLNLTFFQMSVSIVKTNLRSHSPFQYTWLDPIAALWGWCNFIIKNIDVNSVVWSVGKFCKYLNKLEFLWAGLHCNISFTLCSSNPYSSKYSGYKYYDQQQKTLKLMTTHLKMVIFVNIFRI